MRNRQQDQTPEQIEVTEWPDVQWEVDDEAFAKAIAEGRESHVAA